MAALAAPPSRFVAHPDCPECKGTGIDPHPIGISTECHICWRAILFAKLEAKERASRGMPSYTTPEQADEVAWQHQKRARRENSDGYESWCEQRDEAERASVFAGAREDWGASR